MRDLLSVSSVQKDDLPTKLVQLGAKPARRVGLRAEWALLAAPHVLKAESQIVRVRAVDLFDKFSAHLPDAQ